MCHKHQFLAPSAPWLTPICVLGPVPFHAYTNTHVGAGVPAQYAANPNNAAEAAEEGRAWPLLSSPHTPQGSGVLKHHTEPLVSCNKQF